MDLKKIKSFSFVLTIAATTFFKVNPVAMSEFIPSFDRSFLQNDSYAIVNSVKSNIESKDKLENISKIVAISDEVVNREEKSEHELIQEIEIIQITNQKKISENKTKESSKDKKIKEIINNEIEYSKISLSVSQPIEIMKVEFVSSSKNFSNIIDIKRIQTKILALNNENIKKEDNIIENENLRISLNDESLDLNIQKDISEKMSPDYSNEKSQSEFLNSVADTQINHPTSEVINIEDEINVKQSSIESRMDTQKSQTTSSDSNKLKNDYADSRNLALPKIENDLVMFDYSKAQEITNTIAFNKVDFKKKVAPENQGAIEEDIMNSQKYLRGDDKDSDNVEYSEVVELEIVSVLGNRGEYSISGMQDEQEFARTKNGKATIEYWCDYKDECSKSGSQRIRIINERNEIQNTFVNYNNKNEKKLKIPFIEEEFKIEIEKKYNISSATSILVKLDEFVDDINMDTKKYQGKIYLNKNLKTINNEENDYEYVYFLGVSTGIQYINIKNNNGEVITKLAAIHENEVNYFDFKIQKNDKIQIDLFEEHTLSQTLIPLITSTSNINWLASDLSIQTKIPGQYFVNSKTKLKGEREYFNLKNKNKKMYLGVENNKTVNVPSESYVNYILKILNIDSLKENECVVQINLENKLDEVQISSYAQNGRSIFDITYLDSDGVVYGNPTEGTKKIFIFGHELGSYNIELLYKNGKSHYLETYCSNQSYVIEQM